MLAVRRDAARRGRRKGAGERRGRSAASAGARGRGEVAGCRGASGASGPVHSGICDSGGSATKTQGGQRLQGLRYRVGTEARSVLRAET